MRRSRIGLLLVTVCAVLLVSGCGGHHRHLVVGGVEDSAKWADPGGNMALARRAGYQVIVLSSVWTQPHRAPTADEAYRLRTAVHVAQQAGIEPIVAVYSFGSQAPVTPSARAEFTAYAAAILRSIPTLRYISLGNEPNSKLFWMPQFGPDGSDAAATTYLELLETAYPAMKTASPDVTVIGGSLAARGNDLPHGRRQTHSPTRFIEDLGSAFRASGLSQLPLDLFSIHPYPANSSIPPTVADPNSTAIGIADYPKLVGLLTAAFGKPPPIVYGEYGIQTQIPRSELDLYSGTRAPSIRPVSEMRQADDYVEAIHLAACQPLVRMLVFFHVTDESAFSGLQTGLFYPNGRAKSSLGRVARASQEAAEGEVNCDS